MECLKAIRDCICLSGGHLGKEGYRPVSTLMNEKEDDFSTLNSQRKLSHKMIYGACGQTTYLAVKNPAARISPTPTLHDLQQAHRVGEIIFPIENKTDGNEPTVGLLEIQDCLAEVTGNSWFESVAIAILNELVSRLQKGIEIIGPLDELFEKVKEVAEMCFEWAKEHQTEIALGVLVTLIALGILVFLMPWVIEALGFAELGPVGGKIRLNTFMNKTDADLVMNTDSFAAVWQSRYAGYVPKGSLFSFFQRLGMVWKH
jgi:hypothetical protein